MFVLEEVQYKNILNIENLVFESGKISCIIGESGSGKTTLLRLLNNLISCDKGKIHYNEQSIYEIDPIHLRRQVGMLPQNPTVFEGTVKDNLLIGLKFAEKQAEDDETLKRIMDQVCLKKNLSDLGRELSGGEKQRLALGRLLLLDPEVYLLDEPSSALDEGTEQSVIDKLVDHVKQKKKTLIMITHSRNIAMTYGDKIIEIREGQAFTVKGS